MLKKIMKAALAASLVFSMSSFAYAEDGLTVGGKFREYFGQYNAGTKSGNDSYAAHFVNIGEANVKFNGKAGKISVYHELEAASKNGTSTDFKASLTSVGYATPIGQLDIGNVTNGPVVGPLSGSGWTTSNVPNSTSPTLGIAGYNEDEGIQLTIPLEGLGVVVATMYEKAWNGSEGTDMQAGAQLGFGAVTVRLGMTTSETDDPTTASDVKSKFSATAVRAAMGFGNMGVSLDYASSKTTVAAVDTKKTGTSVGFTMKEAGPGNLIAKYDMTEVKDGDKTSTIDVVFSMPLAKGASLELGYIAMTTKPQTGDSVTESFVGGGFTAAF